MRTAGVLLWKRQNHDQRRTKGAVQDLCHKVSCNGKPGLLHENSALQMHRTSAEGYGYSGQHQCGTRQGRKKGRRRAGGPADLE